MTNENTYKSVMTSPTRGEAFIIGNSSSSNKRGRAEEELNRTGVKYPGFQPELAQVVKRCCTYVLDQGGMIRGMENLGLKPLPFKMTAHKLRHYEGNYVLIRFDGATGLPQQLDDLFKRDVDVIRKTVFVEEEFSPPCLKGPCLFGEIPNPDHEKRLWWAHVNRRFVRRERKKAEKKA